MSLSPQENSQPMSSARGRAHSRWLTHHRYLYVLAKVILACLVVFVAARLLSLLSTLLMPALVGLMLAYVFDPLIDAFERRRVNRTVAIAILALVLLVLLSLLFVMVIPAFSQQFIVTMHRLPAWMEASYRTLTSFARERLGYSGVELEDAGRKALLALQDTLLGVVGNVGASVNTIINALLTPLFFFYFLRDFDRIKWKPLALVPPRFHDYVIARARTMDLVVGGWVRGQLQVASLLAVYYALSLTLLGVKLGYVIGIVAGLLNVIPYVGAATGVVLSVAMVLIEHDGWRVLVGVGAVFSAAVVFDSYFITPRLVGRKVGMHPLTIIVVVLVGGSLFGLVGMLVAVPVAAALSVLAEDVLGAYRRSEFWHGRPCTGAEVVQTPEHAPPSPST